MSEQPEEHVKVSGRPVYGPMADPLEALSRGRALGQADDPTVNEMRHNRRVNARRVTARGGADVSFATGRPQDPMFYWQQNNIPYDVSKQEELKRARDYCRTLYTTHPVIASAIDIYSKYPLTGMELVCKDDALTDFYGSLFFDQLNYEDFLVDVGREYWTVGEAWPLGSFNEMLGVWEDDELVNPNDVDVIKSPFLKEPRFQMALPEVIRKILKERAPKHEYEALLMAYPEFKNFMGDDARMPVSNILLKQIAFKADTFHHRGIPILMRGFRAVVQEEMLNAAQDAIASRLYTPLILTKLGASATDLGTAQPWIPTDDDIAAFEEALDAALAADFRMLTHHFGVSMESVFGRETMPNLNSDFDRLTDRILQVFGLSRTMLTGAEAGKTYASDSINRDLVSQLLTSYQRLIKRLFRERALVVAEAQQHFDYEERGGKRYPILEEVLEVDPHTGERRIVEKPKLLVPELHIKAMTMQDEENQRQFLEALRAGGVPISMKTRLTNVPIDLKEEIDLSRQEQVDLAVEAQETRRATFEALRSKGLPIPQDLRDDFEPKAMGARQEGAAAEGEQVLPSIGTQQPADAALVPTPDEMAAQIAEQQQAAGLPANGQVGIPSNVVSLPRNRALDPSSRPTESDEQRASMPKASALVSMAEDGTRIAQYLQRTARVVEAQAEGEEPTTEFDERWVDVPLEGETDGLPGGLMAGPRHIGSRANYRFRDEQGRLLPLDA